MTDEQGRRYYWTHDGCEPHDGIEDLHPEVFVSHEDYLRVAQSLSRCVRYLESLGLGGSPESAAGAGREALKETGYDLDLDRKASDPGF